MQGIETLKMVVQVLGMKKPDSPYKVTTDDNMVTSRNEYVTWFCGSVKQTSLQISQGSAFEII